MNIKHIISIQCNTEIAIINDYINLIEQSVIMTLQSEMVDVVCVVNVLVTDDDSIRRYNRDYREIDEATDVLSFPMQSFLSAGWGGHGELEFDEDTGELPLGDIVLSFESVERQAVEYGKSIEWEFVYMTAHSVLHLLGYDHDCDDNEREMQCRKDLIMKEMGFLSDN